LALLLSSEAAELMEMTEAGITGANSATASDSSLCMGPIRPGKKNNADAKTCSTNNFLGIIQLNVTL
jgi:hypothetical protein